MKRKVLTAAGICIGILIFTEGTRYFVQNQKCQKQLFDLEKEGKAFIFAPSNPPKMSTYTMDREVEQQLYDLGMKDFHDGEAQLKTFLTV